MKPKRISLQLAGLAAAISPILVPLAQATNFTWTAAGDGNWTDTTKWTQSGDADGVPDGDDTVIFNTAGSNGAESIYLNGAQAITGITVNNTATTTLLGGVSGSPATNGLAMSGGFTTTGTGTLTVGDTTGSAPVNLTLSGAATNKTWAVGAGTTLVIANAMDFGTNKIQQTGAGTLVLRSANTGAGVTTAVGGVNYNIIARLDAGTVEFGNAAAFGTGAIDFRNVTLRGSSAMTISNLLVHATGSPIIGGSSNLEFNGGYILSNGANSQSLTINNTGTTLFSGTMSLNDIAADATAQTLTVNVGASAGTVEISGLIRNSSVAGTSVGALTKTGSGTLVISGANNTYSGGTTIGTANGAGVLRATASGALGTGTITFDGSGGTPGPTSRLELSGGITLANAITLSQRNNTSDAIRNLSGSNTLSGPITVAAGGNQARIQSDAGLLTLSGAISTTSTSARNFYLQGEGNGLVSNVLSDNGITNGRINLFKEGGGTWTLSNANTYRGTTTVSGGTVNATNDASLGSATDSLGGLVMNPGSGTATVNFSSATPSIGSLASSGAGTSSVVLGNTTTSSATTLSIGGNGTSTTFGGSISDGTGTNVAAVGNVTKAGAGSLTFTGVNTYTGATAVSAGSLFVNGSLGNTAVTVASGATFGGVGGSIGLGAASVTINSGGILSNGAGAGLLTVNGSVSIAGTFSFDYDGDTTSADLLDVNGTLTLNNATLNLSDLGGNSYVAGDKFTLISYDVLGVGSTFSGFADDQIYTIGGGEWRFDYDDTLAGQNGGTGSNFVTITAVPEPAAAFLGAIGLLAILRRRRL